MSSCYSSRRTSVRDADLVEPATQSTTDQTSCPPQPSLSWFEMSSNASKEETDSAVNDSFDIETLIYKLQMHQLDLQEHQLATLIKSREESVEARTIQSKSNQHSRMNSEEDSPTLPALSEPLSILPTPLPEQTTPVPAKSTAPIPLPEQASPKPLRTTLTKNFSMKNRAARPAPLKLFEGHVSPQQVQSAMLPPRSSSKSTFPERDVQHTSLKKHRRRMTISAASGQESIPMLVLSPGKFAEIDVPPVPELTYPSSTAVSPPNRSPATPTEDQIRMELEAIAMDGDVIGLQKPRTQSFSQKRRGVFIPDDQDRVVRRPSEEKSLLKLPLSPRQPVEMEPVKVTKSPLSRKKSIFGRFERKVDDKNEVDQLLDLYFTDNQKQEEQPHLPKHKSSLSKLHTLFRQRKHDDVPIPVPQISITS